MVTGRYSEYTCNRGKKNMHYTYMLRCKDNTYYTGYTNDLEKRLKSLEMMHGELYMMTSMQPDLVKQRLLNRFANEKFPIEADDPTLLREVLFYIDRGDVTEELTRLSSHFEQFRKFLDSDVPVGRSLDFLMQELFREITTLGNKAFAGGVSRKVVAFKAEAEKIREQIQNVE